MEWFYFKGGLVDRSKASLQIGNNVINMLCTDRQANGSRCNALICQFLCVQLRVGCGSRMYNQRFYVGNVCQQREDFQMVDEAVCFFLTALDLEGEDGTATVREVLLVESVVRMLRQGGVVYLCNLWMVCQELDYLLGVLCMTL